MVWVCKDDAMRSRQRRAAAFSIHVACIGEGVEWRQKPQRVEIAIQASAHATESELIPLTRLNKNLYRKKQNELLYGVVLYYSPT